MPETQKKIHGLHHEILYWNKDANSEFQFVDPNIYSHNPFVLHKRDEKKDLEEELIKMTRALFNIIVKRAEFITDELVKSAMEGKINIQKFCLRMETWESISMLIIVDEEDYLSDKIETLYNTIHQLSAKVNNENFNWQCIVTHNSATLDLNKIQSEGYTLFYEPKPEPRKT